MPERWAVTPTSHLHLHLSGFSKRHTKQTFRLLQKKGEKTGTAAPETPDLAQRRGTASALFFFPSHFNSSIAFCWTRQSGTQRRLTRVLFLLVSCCFSAVAMLESGSHCCHKSILRYRFPSSSSSFSNFFSLHLFYFLSRPGFKQLPQTFTSFFFLSHSSFISCSFIYHFVCRLLSSPSFSLSPSLFHRPPL
ncbi:hypothetical protein ASPWEDRAFT_218330 [Aspergillus wentii DTO 134E9]|uniref:Uncharacterized protein n=1 Tax=Aspergillus wentii DTO 134E9 TaxID=1073089 RepID=A0A1L9RZX4_ASPWE|nr:uncharacterized protein ASPWEDRAFT_218330 [Aspergillus wentii DTO 134E9]OJJ40491.1 hypothetical protein ASPWEDRAFT_218330 [Aspergillus wentii DTO 134E9]